MIANVHEFPDVFIHPDLGRISFRHTRECRDVAYLVVSALVFYVMAYAADPLSSWVIYFDHEPTMQDIEQHPEFKCLKHGDVIVLVDE